VAGKITTKGLKFTSDEFFKASAGVPKLFVEMHRRLGILWQVAASAFVRTAITRVLVDTGMSAASFFPLSKALKRLDVADVIRAHIDGNRKATFRIGIPEFPDGKRLRGRQNEAAGLVRGKQAYILELGTPTKPILEFQFVALVYQLEFHERRRRALDVGLIAFREVLNKNLGPVVISTITEHILPIGKARARLRRLKVIP